MGKRYFVAYVYQGEERTTYHNGEIYRAEILDIFDIEKIERAVEDDRGYERGTVKVINYQEFF